VVKSVIVPAANMMSNMFQLLSRGVPVKAIIHGMGAKTAEISKYVKRRAQEVDLEADLRAAEAKNDTGLALKLSNQIQSIRDSYRRMSIWPLIEAGEFSAISQGQVTAEDLAISDGTFMDWVEAKANGLKEPLRTPARYALVTRDTALFQGLARAVQYGDFVAKAVLYDDLTSRKKLDKKEAIATVNEAFVNYNRLAGRGRQYLESVGLMWFYSYKLRIMKEAVHQPRASRLRVQKVNKQRAIEGSARSAHPASVSRTIGVRTPDHATRPILAQRVGRPVLSVEIRHPPLPCHLPPYDGWCASTSQFLRMQ
jgi:hypothetical protein